MNIVALSGTTRLSGGIYYAASSLCKALDATGVWISAFGRRDQFFHEDSAMWVPVPVSEYRAFGPLGSSPELRRMLADSHSDLLHQHGIWMDDQWATLQWQKKTARPVVISPHGMLDPWAVRNSAWKKKLAGWLFANESLRRADCIHALCQSEAEAIRAYGLTNPIAIIPNGVELPAQISNHCPLTAGGKRKLLFLGRIHPKKGLAELISGWAKAQSLKSKDFSEWQLLIAGWDDGRYEQGLKELAEGLGVGDAISFLGSKFGDEKEALLRNVDAFILPSFSEGLPMSVLEAWSYGLPVVMTDFCNIPEGFVAGAALEIEPNAESIAGGLAQLGDMSASDLSSMGDRGRKLVERQFTWDKIAQDMKAVYEWCLGGEKPSCIYDR